MSIGLGKAGTENPNGAFGPGDDDGEGQEAVAPPQRREVRQAQPKEILAPSAFMDPEEPSDEAPEAEEPREAAEPRPRKKAAAPREEAPAFDWTAESARARVRAEQERMTRTQQLAVPMIQRLQSIPDPRAFTMDQIASMTPEEKEQLDRARVERAQLESNLGQIPVMLGTEAKVDNANVAATIQLQRQYAERYPDIAKDVLDQARTLSLEQQADPQVYEFLVDREFGKQARKERENQNIRAAGSKVSSAGRGSYSSQQSVGVSSVDRNKMRRMGIESGNIEQTIERALRGQNG